MVSSTNPAYNLTVHNTASGAYSLKVMTVVVIIFLPLVLAYQTWTYYVFRAAAGPIQPHRSYQPRSAGRQQHLKATTRLPAMDPDGKRRPYR
jgi:hypothetical protein